MHSLFQSYHTTPLHRLLFLAHTVLSTTGVVNVMDDLTALNSKVRRPGITGTKHGCRPRGARVTSQYPLPISVLVLTSTTLQASMGRRTASLVPRRNEGFRAVRGAEGIFVQQPHTQTSLPCLTVELQSTERISTPSKNSGQYSPA